jgi:hypothetical protein
MGLAFGGKELVFEEDPNLNLRKVHYHLIRDKGLSLVSCCYGCNGCSMMVAVGVRDMG